MAYFGLRQALLAFTEIGSHGNPANSTRTVSANATVTDLSSRVDTILWSDWDPIGVNTTPEAEGEYSSYVPALVALLLNGADEQKLAHHLHSIEQVSMGISSGLDHCRHAARKLLEAYRQTHQLGNDPNA